MRTDSRRNHIVLLLLAAALTGAAGCPQPIKPIERQFLSAGTLANRLNLRLTKEAPDVMVMQNGDAIVRIYTGPKGYMYLNGQALGQPDNAMFRDGKVWVLASVEPLLQLELRRLTPKKPPPPPKPTEPVVRRPIRGATIVVDAGHGGKDPGARGVSPNNEASIVLDIAMRLVKNLRDRGAKVVTTRDSDRFIELEDRAAMADRTHADVFISIHADSAQRRSASGITIYTARNRSIESMRIAMRLEGAMRRAGLEVNGTRTAGYKVLVDHSRPAALIESGYLTNSGDSARLNSPAYRQKLADAIADGLADHFGK